MDYVTLSDMSTLGKYVFNAESEKKEDSMKYRNRNGGKNL